MLLHRIFKDQVSLLVFVPFVVTQSKYSPPAKQLLWPTLWNKRSQCQKLLLGAKKTVWQNKTGLQTFHNSVCLAAWVDAEFHYLFKLLQICSKELSLVGRATRTRTSTFTSDNDVNRLWSGRNSRPSQAVLSASLRDRPSGVFLQTPANRDPSPSASPPGETLIQHLKQNRKTCLSVWELSRLSLPSATRLYMQPCCCPGAGYIQ